MSVDTLDTLMISSSSYIHLLKIKLKSLELENEKLSQQLENSRKVINKAHNIRIQTIYREVDYRNDLANKECQIKALEKRLKPSLIRRLIKKMFIF